VIFSRRFFFYFNKRRRAETLYHFWYGVFFWGHSCWVRAACSSLTGLVTLFTRGRDGERSAIKLTQPTAFEWLSQGFALLNTFLLAFKRRTCPQIFQRDILQLISVEKINKPRRHFVVILELVWGGERDAVPSAKAVRCLCFWQPHVSIGIGPRVVHSEAP
jgi:hypothetical protein